MKNKPASAVSAVIFTFILHLWNYQQPLMAGYQSVEKLGERASVYGRAKMYAALVST